MLNCTVVTACIRWMSMPFYTEECARLSFGDSLTCIIPNGCFL
jgi:hypothetical protein